MGHDRDKDKNEENYHFIKETIKRKPLDKKEIVYKIAAIVGSGVLFGCCASAACVGMLPVFVEQFGIEMVQNEDLRIVTPSPEVEHDSTSAINTDGVIAGTVPQDEASPLENYEAIYSEVLRVSEEPRKALVTVKGISDDHDLLDDSQLSYNSSHGILFLETDAEVYILTRGYDVNDVHDLEITFSDGSTAVGSVCKKDEETGLLVAKVQKSQLSIETIRELYVVNLGAVTSLPDICPVIAIGCPTGDKDAVVYGMMTSVSGRMQVADSEYNILATDMHGSPEGSGVLLNTSGEVIGIIIQQEKNTTGTIRALAISQICPLIENLCNGRTINYTGIYGSSISQAQSDRLHIPTGIYVDKVAGDSPAMVAGIQSGDIISAVNGVKIKNMQMYNKHLQKMDAGSECLITISRNSAGGRYVEMDFKVRVEER